MNEVKRICDIALDVPAPPLRDARTALALARRSSRRRDGFAVAASALAVVAVTGAAVLPKALDRPHATTMTAPSSAAVAALVPVPSVPTWQQAQEHGQRIAEILMAAVPDGYHAAPEYPSPDGATSSWQVERTSKYISTTSILVSSHGHEGLLQGMFMRDEVAAPQGDLCAAAVTARFEHFFGVSGTCQELTVNGVAILAISGQHPDLGAVTFAVRMLDGGFFAVEASAGRYHFDADTAGPPDAHGAPRPAKDPGPPLTGPALTAAQLAELAANPQMLP
jgi:hypothetical protein